MGWPISAASGQRNFSKTFWYLIPKNDWHWQFTDYHSTLPLSLSIDSRHDLDMTDNHTRFWLALLAMGDNAVSRAAHWNRYLYWKSTPYLRELIGKTIADHDFKCQFQQPSSGEIEILTGIAKLHGGYPEIPPFPDAFKSPAMDFSNHVFENDASFQGYILIGARFENTIFEKNAWFRNALFIGTANFNGAKFRNSQNALGDGSAFDRAVFQNTAYFKGATFNYLTTYSESRFMSAVYFDNGKFVPLVDENDVTSGAVDFRGSKFHGDVDFNGARLQVGAGFKECSFHRDALFLDTKFGGRADFNNSAFKAKTSFRRGHFTVPPTFFEARLHEDTDFGDVQWNETEKSYRPPWRIRFFTKSQGKIESSPDFAADDAVRAWDRLALIMSRFEKPHERHTFYRLRMRAQRAAGIRGPVFLANWLFDALCDYGWGLGRTLAWWAGHMVIMALVLTWCAKDTPSVDRPGCGPALWESLVVSFANAHAIFSLGSQDGYLHDVRECLELAVRPEWMMPTVGTVQAVIGPILLFLLLLTIRNRFRLG